jgi:lipopolysaccharide cholinephosphotransferase
VASSDEILYKKKLLELADIFDKFCRDVNIKYSLMYDSLIGAVENNGFAPWTNSIFFALLIKDYLKIINILKKQKIYNNVYVLDSYNSDEYDAIYASLCMRSRVTLPAERKSDEKYYDYKVYILPLADGGDTVDEYNKRREMLKVYYKQYFEWYSYPNIKKSITNREKAISDYRQLRTRDNFLAFRDTFFSLNDENSEYILYPFLGKERIGYTIQKSTFKNFKDTEFEGYSFMTIENPQCFLKDYYDFYNDEQKMKKYANSVFSKLRMQGPEFLRRMQLIETELIAEVDRICRKHSLNYTLAAGSLIGALRHKGFIPWDDDTDIIMPYKDYLKFNEIIQTEVNKDKFTPVSPFFTENCNLTLLSLRRNDTYAYYADREGKTAVHPGVNVEIFPAYPCSKSKFMTLLQFKLCKFFRKMTWASLGKHDRNNKIKNFYYNLLSKVPVKRAFTAYMKCATAFKGKNNHVFFPNFGVFSHNLCINDKTQYESPIEILFEGHMFYAPKNPLGCLESQYYSPMDPPIYAYRKPAHFKNKKMKLDLGDLYSFDNEMNAEKTHKE